MFLFVFSLSQAPQQMGTLAFYRYEQPIVDYCQAHQPLHMNRGFEPPSQALEGLGARERCGVPSTGLLPSVPAAPLSDIRTLPQWAGDGLVPVACFPRWMSPEGVRSTPNMNPPLDWIRDIWASVINYRLSGEDRIDSVFVVKWAKTHSGLSSARIIFCTINVFGII